MRTKTAGLAEVFQRADRKGGDQKALDEAWCFLGRPTTWKNVQRGYKAHRDTAPQSIACRVSKPATRSTSLTSSQPALRRSKPSAKAKLRLPSRFVEAAARDKLRHIAEWKVAHKKMTEEADVLAAACKLGTKGNTCHDVAARWDAQLSPNNQKRLSGKALWSWRRKGKRAGSSPQEPGPKKGKVRAALIDSGKSLSRAYQVEGKCKKPREIVATLVAAVKGTPHARGCCWPRRQIRQRASAP